jgi:radical SAM protein with 4Fe4S-binding SPASM domain
MASQLRWLKYFLPVQADRPIYLIFFVTSKCMGKCRHCFYHESLNRPENPLSLDEIEKFCSTAGNLLQLILTGGEPVLRDDLAEIIKIFYRLNRPFNIGLATSGFQPDKLEKVMTETLGYAKESNFTVGLPIEGPPELNDEIRGIKGFFEKTEASAVMLKRLKKNFPRLSVLVDITASSMNQDHLAETYIMVRDRIKPDLVNLIITRGEPRDPETKKIDPDILEQVLSLMESDIRSGKIPGYGFNSKLLHAKDVRVRKAALEIFRGNPQRMKCRAGDLVGVVYPEGAVYPCELWKEPMGDLRKAGYDLQKIWGSKKAREIRSAIKSSNCSCYHQCFLSPSLFFDPAKLPSLLLKSFALGRGR